MNSGFRVKNFIRLHDARVGDSTKHTTGDTYATAGLKHLQTQNKMTTQLPPFQVNNRNTMNTAAAAAESPIPSSWWADNQQSQLPLNANVAANVAPQPYYGGGGGRSNPMTATNNGAVYYGQQQRQLPQRQLPGVNMISNDPVVSNQAPAQTINSNSNNAISASGLIRLCLRKPMGIVFEPMTTPNGEQRGVRICDLPRTGAASLSGRLQVGDELLSINDVTMSRLSFDEILDFIIEANAERVELLFR